MKALVTGGGGFLGRAIVEQLLANQWDVRILGRTKHDDLIGLGVEQVCADIRDKEKVIQACEGVDCVFHTAALAGIWGDKKVYEGINIGGTDHVIEGCHVNGVKYLVYTSSPSVVFDGKDQQMLDESTSYPSNYLCHYPRTKAIAERKVLASNDKDKLLTVALRPHLIWGVGDNHLIPRLIDRAKAGKLRVVGQGQNEVDMVYVDNAAESHLLAFEALKAGRAAGEAYFITNGEPVHLWPWINGLLKALGIREVRKRISFKAAWKIGSSLECVYKAFGVDKEPRMTKFLAAQLSTHHTYSIDKARKDLGYNPKVSMAEGMERLLISFR